MQVAVVKLVDESSDEKKYISVPVVVRKSSSGHFHVVATEKVKASV